MFRSIATIGLLAAVAVVAAGCETFSSRRPQPVYIVGSSGYGPGPMAGGPPPMMLGDDDLPGPPPRFAQRAAPRVIVVEDARAFKLGGIKCLPNGQPYNGPPRPDAGRCVPRGPSAVPK